MGRLVKLEGKAPKVISEKEAKFPIGVCTCGLSHNFPFCDGSHKRTEDEEEGVVYVYDGNTRVKVESLKS
jgi:CDGSH-type Zn-finger protein